jgi:phage/plasmid-associated DNA primase
MREPAVVQAATTKYETEMDDVGQFIDQHCELGPDLMAPATELFKAFLEATSSRMTQQVFGSRLRQRGFESGRITSGPNKAKHGWKGLRLLTDAEREAQDQGARAFGAGLDAKMQHENCG